MDPSPAPAPRRPWIALVLGLLCNGLGHVYAGRVAAGVVVQILWLAVATALMVAARSGPAAAAATGLLVLAFWVGQAVLAARSARAAAPRQGKRHLFVLGLATFYAATVAVAQLALPPLKTLLAETFWIPAGSMIPTVQVGDYVVVSKGRPLERGAVAVHAAPPGSPRHDPLLKRIVGLAGDTVEVQDGRLVLNGVPVGRVPIPGPCTYDSRAEGGGWRTEPCLGWEETVDGCAYHTQCAPDRPCGDSPPVEVPPGHVFVLGDHRDRSADSRVYGPVPVEEVLGRVEWIPFSWGPSGVRWERIGQRVR